MKRFTALAAMGSLALAAGTTSALAEIPSADKRVAEGRALLVEKKYTEAGDLFKQACDKKVGEGCYWLAKAVRDYRYPPATLAAHYALTEKSCDLKFGQGCFSIAIDYRSGSQGLDIDKAKGNGFMRKSCDYGWGSGCGTLASDHQYGFNDQPKDEKLAFAYFNKGCDAKQPSAEACKDAAIFYAEGTGTPANLNLAIEKIKKAYELSPEDREFQQLARILLARRDKETQ